MCIVYNICGVLYSGWGEGKELDHGFQFKRSPRPYQLINKKTDSRERVGDPLRKQEIQVYCCCIQYRVSIPLFCCVVCWGRKLSKINELKITNGRKRKI